MKIDKDRTIRYNKGDQGDAIPILIVCQLFSTSPVVGRRINF